MSLIVTFLWYPARNYLINELIKKKKTCCGVSFRCGWMRHQQGAMVSEVSDVFRLKQEDSSHRGSMMRMRNIYFY